MLRLPKQIYLLIAAAIVLAILLRQIDRQTADSGESILEAELIQGIPTIPSLSGWPQGLLDELKSVHTRFQDPESGIEALASLGELYLANGFYGEARQCFSTLIILEPRNPRWPYFLGIATRDFRDKRVAIDAFERAIRLDSEYLNIQYELGSVYVASGHILDSVVHFEALRTLDDWTAWAHFGLARGFAAEGRYSEAADSLEVAIACEKEARSISALLDKVAIGLGDRELAAKAREKRDSLAFDKAPYDPWMQSLWDRCFDPIRLTRLAMAEALAGNGIRGQQILDRARSLTELTESEELKALVEILKEQGLGAGVGGFR
jgi:tetratricopeptide (TPR) repeat protein